MTSSAPTSEGDLRELAHPIREDSPGQGTPAWKDNAYLVFWDPANAVFGVVHVSTSSNSTEGRRARASLSVRGQVGEVAEELAPGTWTSDSIDFAQDGRSITVTTDELSATLEVRLRGQCADYNKHGLLPALVEGEAPQHFQGAVKVTGTAQVGGATANVAGIGMRDRTWGFRDESAQFPEYYGLIIELDGRMLTIMKFAQPDGGDLTDGFLLSEGDPAPVREVTRLRRDASGLFAAATATTADGEAISMRLVRRHAGFWVPLGSEREGPTMSAYDELIEVETPDGARGFGLFEQGIVRELS